MKRLTTISVLLILAICLSAWTPAPAPVQAPPPSQSASITIDLPESGSSIDLVLPAKEKGKKVAKVTVMNNTKGYITLILTGPATYTFNLKKGKNVIEVVPGKYKFTAYGCGGASLTGTQKLKNNKTWRFWCTR